MITTGSKYFFGGAAFAMVAAWVYGWGTGGGLTGVMLLGLLGGVGELTGYTVLVGTSFVLAGLGTATSILRDADPERQALAAGLEQAPVVAPSRGSYWPAVGALSFVLVLVGLVASPMLFAAGALGALIVAIEWMVTAWSDRATGDAATNRRIRDQLMRPFEVPIGAALVILVVVLSFSRIFLTLEARTTSITALVLGSIVLGVGFFIAYRPQLPKDVIAGLVVLGALVVIGAGIAAAAAGPRDFEHHEPTHDEAGADEHGAAGPPASPILLESNQ
jgi:hypothetical protein